MKLTELHIILLTLILAGFFFAGCGKDPAVEEEEPLREKNGIDEPGVAEHSRPEEIIAAFQASAESLGFRNESDPSTGVYLYFDEATELLYRVSLLQLPTGFLPEVGTLSKRTNEDGFQVIESTIYASELIRVGAVSVLSGDRADRGPATEKRMRQIQKAFAKALREAKAG